LFRVIPCTKKKKQDGGESQTADLPLEAGEKEINFYRRRREGRATQRTKKGRIMQAAVACVAGLALAEGSQKKKCVGSVQEGEYPSETLLEGRWRTGIVSIVRH